MAIKTVSIGNMENWHQYDDTEIYDDASAVQGIKASTIQVTSVPVESEDVMRLVDKELTFNEFGQSPVVDRDLTNPPSEERRK